MELFRALAVVAEAPDPASANAFAALELDVLPDAADHAEAFTFARYPYASVYLSADGMLGGEPADKIAGFVRALQLTPPPEPDHLAFLLGLAATLAEAERTQTEPARALLVRRSRAAFVWEHLASWLPPYLERFDDAVHPAYRAWARLLEAALAAELATLGTPGATLPAHYRDVPPLADPRTEGLDALVSSLLAPLRSGAILLRRDLVRAARDLGLGARFGERRFVLRTLLAHDAGGTLGWLAQFARSSAERLQQRNCWPEPYRDFWSGRANASAALLETVADEASELREGAVRS